MQTHERLVAYLRDAGAAFRVVEHAAAASADEYHRTLGTRYEQQVKALLVRLDGASGPRPFVVVGIQAQKRLDLGRVANSGGAKNARLASREELRAETGCGFGELPPLGRPFGLPLFLDVDLLREDELYFNAGALTRSVVMAPAALVALESPAEYR